MNKIVLILLVAVCFDSIQSAPRFNRPNSRSGNRSKAPLQPSNSIKPADDTTKKDSSPEKPNKKVYNSIQVNNGAISFDDVPVYTAPPNKLVQVKAGRILIDRKLAFDYNTGKTYIAPFDSKTQKSSTTQKPSIPFSLYFKGTVSVNDRDVYKFPLDKSISWKDNRIYINGKLAYNVNTGRSYIQSYEGEQQTDQLIDNDNALFTQVSQIETQTKPEESKPPTPAPEPTPQPPAQVEYYSVEVDNGEIAIDRTQVYTAPRDKNVYVKNGKIYVEDELVYDYNTGTTYKPSHKLTKEEIENPIPKFSIYWVNGKVFMDDSSVYRVPRRKTISWKDGQIFVDGVVAFDVRTKKQYMPPFSGSDSALEFDKEILKIKDGKVIRGEGGIIYIDDVPIAEDSTLKQKRVRLETIGDSMYVNNILILKANPAEWPYKFPSVLQVRGNVTKFEITVKNGGVYYKDSNCVKEARLYQP